MGYFPDLLEEYKQLLSQMKQEGVTSGDLYREVQQAVKWMETGYDPAEYRAATRQDIIVMDIHLMQDVISYVDGEELVPNHMRGYIDNLSEIVASKKIEQLVEFKGTVKKVMRDLTDNERAAFVLVKCELLSYSKVARVMGVTKGSVQNYVMRATRKIQKNIVEDSLEQIDYAI